MIFALNSNVIYKEGSNFDSSIVTKGMVYTNAFLEPTKNWIYLGSVCFNGKHFP